MKVIILNMLIVILLPINIYGQQNLSLDALIKLKKSNFIEVNDILTKKGWEFARSEDENENFKKISWSYKQNEDLAQAWLTIYTNENDNENIFLSYTFSNSKIYNSIISEINAYKMKRIKNQIGDNSISTNYQGKNYTVMINISSTDDFGKSYVVDICKNIDYNKSINSERQAMLDSIAAAQADSISNAASLIADEYYNRSENGLGNEYNGKFLYKTLTYTNAAVYMDISLKNQIYTVPEKNYVYVLSENNGRVYVYCNNKYGYMLKGMLK